MTEVNTPPALPVMAPPAVPASGAVDDAQLQLLAVFHYVLAGLNALFALIPGLYVAIGIAVVSGALPTANGAESGADPAMMGWFFVAFGSVLMALGFTLAGFVAYAGRCLARRRRHQLCMGVAGIQCLSIPFGTVLGVFTLIVLSRPAVKAAFAPPSAGTP